jgi:uracil-DNA glycosylase family 4
MKKLSCIKSCPFLCQEGIDFGKFNPVLPDGPVDRILAIGEAPGAKEITNGYGFAGIAGRNLTRAFEEQGIPRENWARTNVVWCRPEKNGTNRKPSSLEVESCGNNVEKTIQELKPRVIVVVGETAATALGIYNKKTDGGWLTYMLKCQSDFETEGIDAFHWYHCPVIPMPHSSPLSWNRSHNDRPIKEIGKVSLRIAATIFLNPETLKKNRLA